MPPRIPQLQCLRAQSCSQYQNAPRAFSSSPAFQASTATQRRKHRDPYAIAQAKARKAANLSRQGVLKQDRASVLGDPIRGTTTPFVRSFDSALPPEPSPSSTFAKTRIDDSPLSDAAGPKSDTGNHLNFFLSKDELDNGIVRSKWLSTPLATKSQPSQDSTPAEKTVNPEFDEEITSQFNDLFMGEKATDLFTSSESREQRAARIAESHDIAQEALRRISSLSLGSSKDRLRVNMERCIEVFGRHNTDQTLPTRPQAVGNDNLQSREPRVGSDTGSSEVQIAILTAKIRALADGLELRGHPDKVNKRNLRLLVHRRAKLLNYLRRKERGGPRWQNLIETLGLTEGTWKGEITL